jgi:hypothetical protein
MFEPWSPHDEPGRLFDGWVEPCSCIDCEAAIRGQAARDPAFVIALKTGCDRIHVTIEYLVETMGADPGFESLLYVDDDYVRSLYVPVDSHLAGKARWWSLTRHEDEEALGLRHVRRKVAIRQPTDVEQARRADRAGAVSLGPVAPLVPLRQALAEQRRPHTEVIADAARWALARGKSMDRDEVALICIADAEQRRWQGIPPGQWFRPGVTHLLTIDIPNWCSLARCSIPRGLPETLWKFFDFLAETGRLDPASDPVPELRKTLLCYGGLGFDGLPREGQSPIRCECYRTHAGPSHGDLSGACRPAAGTVGVHGEHRDCR